MDKNNGAKVEGMEPPKQDKKLDSPARKRSRSESEKGEGPKETISKARFRDFTVTRVLNESPRTKMICLEGRFQGKDDPAVVIMEKPAFKKDALDKILAEETNTKNTLQNDIYGTYELYPQVEFNEIKASLIYPATEKHIQKYMTQEFFLVEESAEDYKNITLPFLESEQFSIQWVYNILEKKQEADRIVFEDTDPKAGFILLPDMKWDRKAATELYLVAIVHKHGIKSLRDLTAAHLPLLKNILEKGKKAILDDYEVPSKKLRIYLHYQPSYYHLHVHFTHLNFEAPGSGVEKAHLLTDVIENLEMDSEYYQKKTLTFTAKASQGLYKKFEEAWSKAE